MKKYKRETLEDLYRVTGKYWRTVDTDYLDTIVHLSEIIDDRLWCEIKGLVDLAVKKYKSIDTLIEALRLFGYEMEEEKRETEEDELSGTIQTSSKREFK